MGRLLAQLIVPQVYYIFRLTLWISFRISFHGPNTNPISHLQIESSKYVKFAPPSKRGACVDVFEACQEGTCGGFFCEAGYGTAVGNLANTANHSRLISKNLV